VPATAPLLLGHRGARHYAPENTIAAFDLALEHGCDGFEFDVRLTLDDCAVLCHDPLYRGRAVRESTYEQLTAGEGDDLAAALLVRRGALPALEPLPRLETVLETFASRAWLDIELKVRGLEQMVIDLLRQWPPVHGVLVSSFLPEVIAACAELDTRLPLGLICDRRAQLALWETLPVSFVLPHRKLLDRELLEEMRVAGKRVMVWTVNDERDMLRFAEWGVDGLISDDTALLGRIFRRAV